MKFKIFKFHWNFPPLVCFHTRMQICDFTASHWEDQPTACSSGADRWAGRRLSWQSWICRKCHRMSPLTLWRCTRLANSFKAALHQCSPRRARAISPQVRPLPMRMRELSVRRTNIRAPQWTCSTCSCSVSFPNTWCRVCGRRTRRRTG